MKKNQGPNEDKCNRYKLCIKKIDFDYLILMDGDGEDRPEEIKNFN